MAEKQAKILSLKSIMVYAFGIFGIQLFIGYINSYQSQFYSSMWGADLMIIAVIILGAKLISAIADPFIGNLIDRSNFKSGKTKPFILLSAFPLALLTTLMFWAFPLSGVGMYIYITATTVLWNIAMSFADIPSSGMLALLSPIAEERNNAAGITNILKSVALAAPGVVVPVVCAFTKSANGAITQKEYIITAVIFLVIGLPLYILIYFFNKEEVPRTVNRMTLKDMVVELKQNKMLFILFLTFMLGFGRNIGMGICVQASAVLLKEGIDVQIGGFHYIAAGENLPWLIGLTSAVSASIMMILAPAINKKWGEKKTFIVFGIYGFVTCVITFILYATGIEAFRSLYAILIYQFIIGFAFGPNGYLPMVMTSDIVDYREWQTGVRTEGTQFAVLSLSNKISNALSVACGIFIVGASHYNAEKVASGLITIDGKMQTIVFVAYILIPGICLLLSTLPMFFYKIDGKTKEIMRSELARRRLKNTDLSATASEDIQSID